MSYDRWFGVDVRHLAALSAVARAGSFRGAAERLGYVQSAVSQQIAHLEQNVGARLVDRERGSRDVALTPEGVVLLGHADEILDRLDAARADLARHAAGVLERELTVGVPGYVAAGLLPAVLRRVAATAPALRIVPVDVRDDAALFERIAAGDLDVAFADLPLENGPFGVRKVLRDPLMLVVPARSALAENGVEPTAAQLARLPLVTVGGGRRGAQVETWFASEGVVPDVVMKSESDATARAFVAAGLGCAILRGLSADGAGDGLAVIDLNGLMPPRQLSLFWHSQRSHGRALETFCNSAVAAAADLKDARRARAQADGRPRLADAA